MWFFSLLNFGLFFLTLCADAVPSEQAFSQEVFFFFTNRVFYRQFTSMLVLHPHDLVSPDPNDLDCLFSDPSGPSFAWWNAHGSFKSTFCCVVTSSFGGGFHNLAATAKTLPPNPLMTVFPVGSACAAIEDCLISARSVEFLSAGSAETASLPSIPSPSSRKLQLTIGPDRVFVFTVGLTDRFSNHRSSPALSWGVHQREQRLPTVVRVNTCCVRPPHGACQRETFSPQIVQLRRSPSLEAIKGNSVPRRRCLSFISHLESFDSPVRLDHISSVDLPI
jgi:hypothetical protein